MAPELVRREFFEKGCGFKEPVLIPAGIDLPPDNVRNATEDQAFTIKSEERTSSMLASDKENEHPAHDAIKDSQDGLDMVIPKHLTVRQVAELYGPSEKVPVIDVKSQDGAGSWTLEKFADYYENPNRKGIKNVISLEVSDTKLARLIKRPKVARSLDLVDSVWPDELKMKGDFPRTQLYCLMSVANSYTDFHIDFGGSSVFYHIISGKKTFLFIPPEKKNLKKYEQWCMSPDQSVTFLPDLTNGCYRVDLSAGDTMMIPSGWIHAVWTPEDTIVIGGNFLTPLHYEMQFQIYEIEKATKTPRKFRMPHFQRIMYFAAVQYVLDDPIPLEVGEMLWNGGVFKRDVPIWEEAESGEHDLEGDPHFYNSRYYSKHEIEGLPSLIDYIYATAGVMVGCAPSIKNWSPEPLKIVEKNMPVLPGNQPPMLLAKNLAWWYAWKVGNIEAPSWSHPETGVPVENGALNSSETKPPPPSRQQPTRASKRKRDRTAEESSVPPSDPSPAKKRQKPSNADNAHGVAPSRRRAATIYEDEELPLILESIEDENGVSKRASPENKSSGSRKIKRGTGLKARKTLSRNSSAPPYRRRRYGGRRGLARAGGERRVFHVPRPGHPLLSQSGRAPQSSPGNPCPGEGRCGASEARSTAAEAPGRRRQL